MACGRYSSPGMVLLAALAAPVAAGAADVTLVGLIGAKAIVAIDGGAPRTIAVGQKIAEGVVLLGIEKDAANFEIDGKKKTLRMGQAYSQAPAPGKQSVTLAGDPRGHFFTTGSVNGGGVRFLVDTGATLVSLSASDATRLGIDYRKGQRGTMQTANGMAAIYRIKLDSVKIGTIEISNVDASVGESDNMGVALLGMSFLNRMEMKRDGSSMILTRRY